jgi:glycosyltransferase involved in cell wall biosynthesis
VRLIAWDRDGGRPTESSEEGVGVFRVGPRSPYRSLSRVGLGLVRFWLNALRASRRIEFDVVHCHDFDTLPLGLLIAKLRGKPVILDAHDIYSLMLVGESGLAAKLVWPVERFLSSKVDWLIATNEAMASMLAEGRDERASIVRNSPDTSVLAGHEPEATRMRYGLKGFVVSYLGSLEPGRAVEELAGAFGPDDGITVLIGGNGTLRPAVERMAEANPAVRFVGTVDADEVLRITAASDLIPAMYDPDNPKYRVCTPIKVLEAMACGKPMVTSRGLDVSEVVGSAGCGMVIGYGRSELSETVRRASADRERLREMGRRGQQYFRKNLAWDVSKGSLIGVYRALLGPI